MKLRDKPHGRNNITSILQQDLPLLRVHDTRDTSRSIAIERSEARRAAVLKVKESPPRARHSPLVVKFSGISLFSFRRGTKVSRLHLYLRGRQAEGEHRDPFLSIEHAARHGCAIAPLPLTDLRNFSRSTFSTISVFFLFSLPRVLLRAVPLLGRIAARTGNRNCNCETARAQLRLRPT